MTWQKGINKQRLDVEELRIRRTSREFPLLLCLAIEEMDLVMVPPSLALFRHDLNGVQSEIEHLTYQ